MMQVLKIRLVYTSRLAYFSCYYLGFVFSAVVMRVEVLWSVPSWWEEPIYLQCRLVRMEIPSNTCQHVDCIRASPAGQVVRMEWRKMVKIDSQRWKSGPWYCLKQQTQEAGSVKLYSALGQPWNSGVIACWQQGYLHN